MKRKRGRGTGKPWLVSPPLCHDWAVLQAAGHRLDLTEVWKSEALFTQTGREGNILFQACRACCTFWKHLFVLDARLDFSLSLHLPRLCWCFITNTSSTELTRLWEGGNSLGTLPWAVESEMANPSSPVLWRVCWWLWSCRLPAFTVRWSRQQSFL